MKSIKALKEQTQARHEKLRDKTIREVLTHVQKACDRFNWDFSAAFFTTFFRRGSDYEIKNQTAAELIQLVFWCDELFPRFPQCMYKGGVWYPQGIMDTP